MVTLKKAAWVDGTQCLVGEVNGQFVKTDPIANLSGHKNKGGIVATTIKGDKFLCEFEEA